MQKPMDKHSEDLVKKIMKETSLESPSLDFTANLMSKIEGKSISSYAVYKPIISKPVRYLIGLGFIALVLFLSFNPNTQDQSLLSRLNLDTSRFSLDAVLGGFEFSKITVYAIVMFCVMLYLQIGLIKTRLNNQFNF